MPGPVTFNVEDYFNEFVDSSAVAELARFKTIPTGNYPLQVTKRDGVYFTKHEKGYWQVVFAEEGASVDPNWRKGVRLQGAVLNADGKKMTTVRVDASWEVKRDNEGKIDSLTRRWDQISKALFPTLKPEERATKSTGDVLQALSQYPVGAYITEAFHVPAMDGSKRWTTPKSDDEAKAYREAGYDAKNFVQSITKV